MPRTAWTLFFLGFVMVMGWIAHLASAPPVYPGLACSGKRVATYGWTHSDRARAELAAIVRWKEIASDQSPAYGEWHNARKRFLSCRTFGGKFGQIQCRIAAMPCKITNASAG